MSKVNPYFAKEMKKLGGTEFNACFNCGTCTATCTLAEKDNAFPRKLIRYSILGLEDDIKSSIEPWLCYYCGDCSDSCPRQADPGNIVMAVRRFLITSYDWTRISGLLFRSLAAYIVAFSLLLLGIIGAYTADIFTKEEWVHYGHYFEMIAIGSVFLVILLPNIIRMWYFTVARKKVKFNIKVYFRELKTLFIHMFSQKRALECDDSKENRTWWLEHLLLVIGYLSLLFTTVFLNWFATGSIFIIVMGYIFSAMIFVVTFDFMMKKFRKKTQRSTTLHYSDWFFIIWLFLMGVSAFAVRLFIDLDLLQNNFWLYLFHLTVLVQWALIIVPFGKWTHFLYRSFAMYFSAILEAPENARK
ncbi:MAG: 4Fe-4S dicluster domain-containing protein [Bacteroidales bacterium]|nr:4Fe-4S dicluster domain-containing protein [Bacteroidales bacterium]